MKRLLSLLCCFMPAMVHANPEPLITDANDFCMEMAVRLGSGDIGYLVDQLDMSGIQSSLRFAGGMMLSNDDAAGVVGGMKKGLRNTSARWALPWDVMPAFANGRNMECVLVGHVGRDGMEDGALYGIRLVVRRAGQGFVLKDIVYANGETILGRGLSLVSRIIESHAVLENPYMHSEAEVARAREFTHFVKVSAAGVPEYAVKLYMRASQEIQQHPALSEVFLMNAQKLEEEKYKEALAYYAKNMDQKLQDPLLLIDHYHYQGDFEKALALLDKLEPFFANSYAIDYLRVGLRLQMGDRKALHAAILSTLEKQPDMESIYWILLDDYVSHREYENAIAVLEVLKVVYGFEFNKKLDKDEKYAELGRSPEYRRWWKK